MSRFTQLNLVARDLAATLAFYRRLGLEIPEDGVWRTASGAHHASAGAGEVELEFDSHRLAHAYNSGFAAERGRVMIGIELESRSAVDRLWRELLEEGCCQGLQAPFDAFWGARLAIVEDPEGNPVGLSSPMDADHRSAPPAL